MFRLDHIQLELPPHPPPKQMWPPHPPICNNVVHIVCDTPAHLHTMCRAYSVLSFSPCVMHTVCDTPAHLLTMCHAYSVRHTHSSSQHLLCIYCGTRALIFSACVVHILCDTPSKFRPYRTNFSHILDKTWQEWNEMVTGKSLSLTRSGCPPPPPPPTPKC